MIDNVHITLRDFSGDILSLKNCSFKGINKKKHCEVYNLVLECGELGSPIKTKYYHSFGIERYKRVNKIIVIGSIRKLCYNQTSLQDLTRDDFEKTIERLAEGLNIPLEELLQGTITQCEIGLNVKTRISCKDIIPAIFKYGTKLGNRKTYPKDTKDETVYFKQKNRELIIYDKVLQIDEEDWKEVGEMKNSEFLKPLYAKIREKHNNILRVEITLYNKKSFTQVGLGHIRIVKDLIDNYADLYDFWTKEVRKIELYNKPEYSIDMSDKEYLFFKRISNTSNIEDVFEIIQEYSEHCIAKKANRAKEKSKVIEEVINFLYKYKPTEEYDNTKFRVDAFQKVIQMKKKRGENIINSYMAVKNLLMKKSSKKGN